MDELNERDGFNIDIYQRVSEWSIEEGIKIGD